MITTHDGPPHKPKAKPVLPAPQAVATPPAPRYPARTALLGCPLLLAGCDLLFPLVAPLFHHGQGYASWGCEAVTDPVYLSEESAVEVLREQLGEAGHDELRTGEDCSQYTARRVWIENECGYVADYQILEGALAFDRFDVCSADGDLGLEYVSLSDFEQVVEETDSCRKSIDGRDMKGAARYVSAELAATARARYVGMFYDPVEYGDTGQGPDGPQRVEGREKLQAQVQDFLAWLDERQRD